MPSGNDYLEQSPTLLMNANVKVKNTTRRNNFLGNRSYYDLPKLNNTKKNTVNIRKNNVNVFTGTRGNASYVVEKITGKPLPSSLASNMEKLQARLKNQGTAVRRGPIEEKVARVFGSKSDNSTRATAMAAAVEEKPWWKIWGGKRKTHRKTRSRSQKTLRRRR